jgi:competence protein ComEC
VVRVTPGDVRFRLGGDCASEVYEAAIDPGEVEVYEVHHDGSSDSSSNRLLTQLRPALALTSVGAGNRYGHPEASTLARLDAVGAEVHRTDEEWSLVVRSDGVSWSGESEATARRWARGW